MPPSFVTKKKRIAICALEFFFTLIMQYSICYETIQIVQSLIAFMQFLRQQKHIFYILTYSRICLQLMTDLK